MTGQHADAPWERHLRAIAAASVLSGITAFASGLRLLAGEMGQGRSFIIACIGLSLGAGMTYLNAARRALGRKPIQLIRGPSITWTTLTGFNVLWIAFIATVAGSHKAVVIATAAVTVSLGVAGHLIEWPSRTREGTNPRSSSRSREVPR
jgi:hypothetical protein